MAKTEPSSQSVQGLDGFRTWASHANPGIDPQIQLHAQNGNLYVLLGNWNLHQARKVAALITAQCDLAERDFCISPGAKA